MSSFRWRLRSSHREVGNWLIERQRRSVLCPGEGVLVAISNSRNVEHEVSTSTVESLPKGFLFSSRTAGIKASGKPDLALAIAPDGASAAAMFTRNQVVAAPLT